MKRICAGFLIALAIVVMFGAWLVLNPPIPDIHTVGDFRCEHDWRLPCDR
jgi:hypothetical protein